MDEAEDRTTDAAVGIDRRSRRAFTVSLAVILVVVVAALGYSFVRDPGPRPTYPPKISGTDDGSLKRAIVHYLGALESGDDEAMTDVMGQDTERSRALAKLTIDEYSSAAKQEAAVTVVNKNSVRDATVRFHDGREQLVRFTKDSDQPWHAWPTTTTATP